MPCLYVSGFLNYLSGVWYSSAVGQLTGKVGGSVTVLWFQSQSTK